MEFKDFRARWGSIQLIFATIPKDYPTFGSAYKGTRNHFWWEGLRNLLIFGSVEKFSGRLEGGPESFFWRKVYAVWHFRVDIPFRLLKF